MPKKAFSPPEFLSALLNARSPSGYEAEAQSVFDAHVRPFSDRYEKDALGNRIAVLNPEGSPSLMLAGHMDELGLIITYVNKEGYLYFDTIGGHDRVMLPGRRVIVHTANGPVKGVTGKRAIHLMDEGERKKLPEIHEMWIDIGAHDRKSALERVAIGDCVTHDVGFDILHGSVATARAFDNKVGAYVVGETLRRLYPKRARLAARITAVATTQEEIGVRGATASAFSVDPQFALVVDVGHATDYPDADPRKFGDFKIGKGPILCRGANVNPIVFKRLVEVAQNEEIPFQVEADPRPTGTDARAIQIARGGVGCGLVSIPLRYMHTPSEVVDLQDVENTVRLFVAFARSLKQGDSPVW
jgi:endoglucanase